MTDKEKAQEAWKQKMVEASAFAGRHNYIIGINEYKQALKLEIEKEKISRGVHGHYADGRTWAFEKVLELLDTVKPIL